MPIVQNDLEGELYQKFIHEAIKRSDMMLFVVRRDFAKDPPLKRPHLVFDEQRMKFLEEAGETPEDVIRRWDERVENDRKQKEAFYENCVPFVEKFKPYLLYVRRNEVWPSLGLTTAYVVNSDIEVHLYRVVPEMEPLLLEPGSLDAWIYGSYPDDLSFFKGNVCWFESTTHEYHSFLYADSPEDVKFWEELGIKFIDGFEEAWDIKRRWVEKGPDGEIWDPPNKPWK